MYSFLKNVHTSYPPARSYRELLAEKIYLYPKQAYETTTNSLQPPTTHFKMRRWFRQLKRTRVAYTTSGVVKRSTVWSRVKSRGCEARFTAVQQHVPGDHARLLVSHSRRRSSLSTFCDVRLWSANCGGRAESVNADEHGELREGRKREAGAGCLPTGC
ncbi:hypothetical protein G5I_05344 [Acromyrmex echinatior]|uniref:Uncharacterized protein n=1 Tax=Acromyrmex echinatior TaxID=103372 RepID=F4WHZ7_ACREC|nr:hypothetical protein G5I_05344 [Acromyrmex echinatior]